MRARSEESFMQCAGLFLGCLGAIIASLLQDRGYAQKGRLLLFREQEQGNAKPQNGWPATAGIYSSNLSLQPIREDELKPGRLLPHNPS